MEHLSLNDVKKTAYVNRHNTNGLRKLENRLLKVVLLTNTSENSPTSTGGEMNRFFVDFVMDEQYKICYNIFSNKYKKESKYQ